ncbi:uncharacterized protein LOC132732180 [Ruditapes philippinarum]|uniref:uncharacterized protein LOC132732180 n=1 Tax=Ruditapes philippinarum TaxID=129788 RepID=UPI00295BE50A|nr:uncharacterized protein LOC132732180 [Ruditapes philippinarum]
MLQRLMPPIYTMRLVRIRNTIAVFLFCTVILAWISFSTLHSHEYSKSHIVHTGQDAIRRTLDVNDSPHYRARTVITNKFGEDSEDVLEKIKSIAKFMHNAKKHVRGSKTSDFLKRALLTMNFLLTDLGLNPDELYNRTTYPSKHVCPEKYMGTTFGYPYFYKGFEITNCTYGIAIWKLVTIIKHVNNLKENPISSIKDVDFFLSSVYKVNSNFSVILAVNNVRNFADLRMKYPSLSVIESAGISEGSTLNSMVDRVRTPYVFVARHVHYLTNDSRLERLIREIEVLGIKVAAGAIRDSEGHWKKGCFQAVYRNYTLKYLEGYDESLHECLFCDYTQGPFVTSKENMEAIPFRNLNEEEGLFEDWFLRISRKSDETITCPDSMFHVNSLQTQNYGQLAEFMKVWDLFKTVMPNGITYEQLCVNEVYQKHKSKALSPCSVQFNADAVKTILRTCENAGIICELQEGTALGAVKLGKTLPWERDADITFLTANYTALNKLKDHFESEGFRFNDLGSLWCCIDNRTAGGKFTMTYKGWVIELYGQHIMDSERLISEEIKPTKVLLDGQWVNVPRNPGLFVRNRYGREIYQHAEHWLSTGGESGWMTYKTDVFFPCSKPGDHDCLDRYNADGDLPFLEVLP